MPYEFQGENLVYVAPPETTGYTWQSLGGGADTAPTEKWVRNEGFDPNSLLSGRVDKYGRVDYSPRADLTDAEKRAYDLTWGGYSPSDYAVKESGANTGIQHENLRSSGWWDVDPALQAKVEAANAANSGNAVGMSSWRDYITPALILAGGAGAAISGGALGAGEAALGAGAGEAGGLTTSEILGSNFAGSNFAIDPLASYAPGLAAESALPTGTSSLSSLTSNDIDALNKLAADQGVSQGDPTWWDNLTGNNEQGLYNAYNAPSGTTLTDVLKGANTARNVLGLGATAAKLLGGVGTASKGLTSTGTGTNPYAGLNGMGTGTESSNGMPAAPKATTVHGTQIASPLNNFNVPTINYGTPTQNLNVPQEIQQAATGGIMHLASGGSSNDELPLKPAQLRGKQAQHANLFGLNGIPLFSVPGHADGGSIPQNFKPEFYSEGGLQHSYVRGAGTGTSDSVPAMLSNGEFVIPADIVSSLGDGSNDSGAKVLDSFLKTVRAHKQKHDAKHLPSKSKGALGYLLEAKRKVKK